MAREGDSQLGGKKEVGRVDRLDAGEWGIVLDLYGMTLTVRTGSCRVTWDFGVAFE